MRSASGWAAWCFQSLTHACGSPRSSSIRHSGVPSAVVGSIVHEVKSMPIPITSIRVDAGLGENPRDGVLERPQVVLRVLQRPVRLQPNVIVRRRQPLVDDAVGVRIGRRSRAPARRRSRPGRPAPTRCRSRRRPRSAPVGTSCGSPLRLDDHLQAAPFRSGWRTPRIRRPADSRSLISEPKLDAALLGELDRARQVGRLHPAAE